MQGRLLVAFDGREASTAAAEFAASRASKTGDTVDVVHIGSAVTEDEMQAKLGDTFETHGVKSTFEVVTNSGSENDNISVKHLLTDLINRREYDYVVLGNETYGVFERLTNQSISNTLIKDHEVPILLVP